MASTVAKSIICNHKSNSIKGLVVVPFGIVRGSRKFSVQWSQCWYFLWLLLLLQMVLNHRALWFPTWQTHTHTHGISYKPKECNLICSKRNYRITFIFEHVLLVMLCLWMLFGCLESSYNHTIAKLMSALKNETELRCIVQGKKKKRRARTHRTKRGNCNRNRINCNATKEQITNIFPTIESSHFLSIFIVPEQQQRKRPNQWTKYWRKEARFLSVWHLENEKKTNHQRQFKANIFILFVRRMRRANGIDKYAIAI